MTRTVASSNVDLEDDKPYRAILHKPTGEGITRGWYSVSTNPQYPGERLVIDWELHDVRDVRIRDWISIKLGANPSTGKPAKLAQLLNALAERPADTALWFDPETHEWGYEMDPGTPAYARLASGFEVMLKGEMRKLPKGGSAFRVTGYKMFLPSASTNGRIRDEGPPDSDLPTDVDPDLVPF
jgi:hypothetical protein